jgi:putative transposase
MTTAEQLSGMIGTRKACRCLAVSRASLYRRWREPAGAVLLSVSAHGVGEASHPSPLNGNLPVPSLPEPPVSPRALSPGEREAVLAVLHDERFQDQSPAEVHATLLDEGRYLCSLRTMYRLLGSRDEVRERRNQLRHPRYKTPELLATGPNQVWSWDITKLLGPVKWSYYYLYVILDIFSRYVVGWLVAQRESATLAQRLIDATCTKQEVRRGELTLHADRGPSMQSKPVALLLADLGVLKSHSRPHVRNDNPYSESQFKTMKYQPEFPDRFGSIMADGSSRHGDARSFSGRFLPWYNTEHHHSALAYLTPEVVHYGLASQVLSQRQLVLDAAYAVHPERFVNGQPSHPSPPEAAWINPPSNMTLR